MAANNNPLIRMLAALDFCDRNRNLGRRRTERAGQIHFHRDRSGLKQAIDEAVILMREERDRELRRLVAAEASHVEQRIGLAAVHKQDSCALVGGSLHHLHAFAKASPSARLRDSVAGRNHGIVRVIGHFRFGRKLRWLARYQNRSLELPLYLSSSLGSSRFKKITLP